MLTEKMIARIERMHAESDGTPLYVVSYTFRNLKVISVCLSEKPKGDPSKISHDAIICSLPVTASVQAIRKQKEEIETYLKGLDSK